MEFPCIVPFSLYNITYFEVPTIPKCVLLSLETSKTSTFMTLKEAVFKNEVSLAARHFPKPFQVVFTVYWLVL